MKITGITWITTYNCNLSCDHCFFETKGKEKYMMPDLIDKALDGFKHDKYIFWHHLSGGEIFLQKKKLIQILKRIRKYFQKNIGISTNGFWAKNEDITEKIVMELAENGVTGIAISADYFHQKQMDLTGPKTLAAASSKYGLKTHSYIMGTRLHADVENSEYINRQTAIIGHKVKQEMKIPFASPVVRSIGKGTFINRPKKSGIPQEKCTELNTCLGKCSPFNPAMIWIDPYGNVMICYGIIIGNIHRQTLNSIIEDYEPCKYPLLVELAENGPKGMYNLALKEGIDSSIRFYDACDLCYQSRNFLRSKFPSLLGPMECYPVGKGQA